MENMKQAQEQYLAFLNDQNTALRTSAGEKRKAGEQYEAVLDNIRMNVVNIFTQMFRKASKEIESNRGPLLEIYTAENDPENIQLEKVYMGLLEKISGQWKIALEEAQKFDDDDNITKEMAKIETAEQLHKKFRTIFQLE